MSVVAVAMWGCVMPPPVDEVDPAANRQPTITVLSPESHTPVALSCDATPPFLAQLADADSRDTLFYRFFVDYDRQDRDDLLATAIGESAPVPIGASRLARPLPDITGRNATIQERPSEVHLVELVVVDREFDDANPDIGDGFYARVPKDGGLTATFQWAVEPVVCN